MMLQVMNDSVREIPTTLTTTTGCTTEFYDTLGVQTTSAPIINALYQPYWYYGNYPVYVCTDKTKKAIDILKHLQAKKRIKCDNVEKFIALVEEIAGLL